MTRENKILAFYSPYPGAGKSTARSIAAKIGLEANHSICMGSFASAVREAAACVLKCPAAYFLDYKNTQFPGLPKGTTGRDVLKAFGAEGRSVWSDIWVFRLMQDMEENARRLQGKAPQTPLFCLIDDLRMPNEYNALHKQGAKIVRVTVPDREIVPSDTEAQLEGCEFDAELLNSLHGTTAMMKNVLDLLIALWPDSFSSVVL